jgi:alginate O-acetyltransferase complex protein AlgI
MFILWGLWHGVLLVFYRLCPIDAWLVRALGRFGKALSIFVFFQLVCFGWIMFRSSFHDFPIILKSIADTAAIRSRSQIPGVAEALVWWLIVFSLPVALADFAGYVRNCEFPDLWHSMPLPLRALLLVCVFYGIVFLGSRHANEFIYFAF